MSELLKTVVVMTITGSVLALALFALKPFIKNRLPKAAQYYLWLVVLTALLVPFSRFVSIPAQYPALSDTVSYYLPTQEELFNRVKPYETELPNGYIGVPEADMPTVEALVPSTLTQELLDWCRGIYPLGVMFVFGYFITTYLTFCERLKRRNVFTDIKSAIPVYRNPLAHTPMLIGFFQPSVILPDREYTDEQRGAVVAHELTHHRRKDILVRWLTVAACSVHWFNPLVWLMRREIDRACELSCDEAVIRKLDVNGRQNYGDTLLYVAADAKATRSALTMCEEKRDLKERLGAIMKAKKRGVLAVCVSVALLITLAVCAVAIGAGRGVRKSNTIETTRVFELEAATSRDLFEKLITVTLNPSGTAILQTPLISSYMLSTCTYEIEGNAVYIYETRYETREKSLAAVFDFEDDNTLTFRSANVPIFADAGARYVCDNLPRVYADVPESGMTALVSFKRFSYTDATIAVDTIAPWQAAWYFGSTVYVEGQTELDLTFMLNPTYGSVAAIDNYEICTPDGTVYDSGKLTEQRIVTPAEPGEYYYTIDVRFEKGGLRAYYAVKIVVAEPATSGARERDPQPAPASGIFDIGFGAEDGLKYPDSTITAYLANLGDIDIYCGNPFTIEKQTGDGWETVPFIDNFGFDLPLYTLTKDGDSQAYVLRPEYLAKPLTPGWYRFVTKISVDNPTTTDSRQMTDVYAAFYISDKASASNARRQLTLDDVRRLDTRGDNLTAADFEPFAHTYSADELKKIEEYHYPIDGGKWEVDVTIDHIDGEDDIVSSRLVPCGFAFKAGNFVWLGESRAAKYIKYIENFTPALLELTPQEEAAALEAVRSYYAGLEFSKGKSLDITRVTDFSKHISWVNVDLAKGKLAAFTVIIKGFDKPERGIILTQTEGGGWEVINEGY